MTRETMIVPLTVAWPDIIGPLSLKLVGRRVSVAGSVSSGLCRQVYVFIVRKLRSGTGVAQSDTSLTLALT
ncbi:hypothetical protein [Phaeobacter sp. J2-8]|uniref:hypothetical protein n=1 Tax=Phaeobacter sp. J2-8 TaxID=2931394 RepID=UPI001FD5743D|nr:hypothetical protein [Phaeobacter sp. J2-8]MCJ7873724.1 hypothetical protein [Phaeobacter sp. J2-8]